MGTIAELQGKPDRLYPLLWLSNEGGSLEDNYKVDNIRLTMFGRVIAGEEGQDDDAQDGLQNVERQIQSRSQRG